jgi:GTP-binding protein
VKILSAELVTSASTGGPREGALRDDVPQFAFWGRSNVGKSSLLNALMRRKLARTSAAPGKTALANIYKVTVGAQSGGRDPWTIYLVDLPGYGYARGGHESRAELVAVVDAYFGGASRQADLAGIFLLIDSRHPGIASDVQAHAHLSRAPNLHVVATKVDKLSRSERVKNLREIERAVGQAPLPVSTTSGEGVDQLWRVISSLARGGHEDHRG